MFKAIVLMCSFAIISRHYVKGQGNPINGIDIDPSSYPVDMKIPMINNSLQDDNLISNIQTPVEGLPMDNVPINMSNLMDTDNLPMENPTGMNPMNMSNPINSTGGINNIPIEDPTGFNPIDMSNPMNNPINMSNPMNRTAGINNIPIEDPTGINPIDINNPMENPTDMNPIDISNPMNNISAITNFPIENPTGINPTNLTDSSQLNSVGVPVSLLSNIRV